MAESSNNINFSTNTMLNRLFEKSIDLILLPNYAQPSIYLQLKEKYLDYIRFIYQSLQFNLIQVSISIYFIDKYITKLAKVKYGLDLEKLTLLFVMSILPTCKLTVEDLDYSLFRELFKISDFGFLESVFYAFLDYQFFVSEELVFRYLNSLV